MIEHMLATGDVWFAPLEAIARHVLSCQRQGTYAPRLDMLPYYDVPQVPRRDE